MRRYKNVKVKNGILTKTGVQSGKTIYPFDFGIFIKNGTETTLFARSSWARKPVDDYIGRKVIFDRTCIGTAYSIGILDKKGNVVKI